MRSAINGVREEPKYLSTKQNCLHATVAYSSCEPMRYFTARAAKSIILTENGSLRGHTAGDRYFLNSKAAAGNQGVSADWMIKISLWFFIKVATFNPIEMGSEFFSIKSL